MVELGHPKLSSEVMCILRTHHILQRPIIGEIDFFEPITREIIHKYINPGVDLNSVPNDDPSNAFACELNTDIHFSNFRMSLKETTNADEYTVETYGQCLWPRYFKKVVTFKEGTLRPDPRYLHLHACVADVLQKSGAARVIDHILKCLPQKRRPADIVDLQGVLNILGLRYSLVAAFQFPLFESGFLVS
ncbi:uncharacterized protein BT62DRAFT_251463 [Guyanagaster necrorhizus]|uniref:Uncharacterized protein n=1 Tax=Guyanagaster necrorhizus TaxID=856835 RepID=A0A9P8AQ81_9AGAR|nr:uncharacterized protein BT62DRAFT_251463 [Guyanagaster necrorhizus MCA 3950]KAG7444093.1 hypothetical protein BT62DRAFT_251463 [Guyanagaster necrorhizus MCA 3950]